MIPKEATHPGQLISPPTLKKFTAIDCFKKKKLLTSEIAIDFSKNHKPLIL